MNPEKESVVRFFSINMSLLRRLKIQITVTAKRSHWSLALKHHLTLKKMAELRGRSDFWAFWSVECFEENGVKLSFNAEAHNS